MSDGVVVALITAGGGVLAATVTALLNRPRHTPPPVPPLPVATDPAGSKPDGAAQPPSDVPDNGPGGGQCPGVKGPISESGYWYVNIGEGAHRNWDDCVRYGFLAAGGGKVYSDQLDRLPLGGKVFAYMKGLGYVGYGEVVSAARRAAEFTPVGQKHRLLDLPLGANMARNLDDPDQCEWVVGVRWYRTFPREQGKMFPGAFANPNIACRVKDERTLKFLLSEFSVTDPGWHTERPASSVPALQAGQSG